MSFLLMIFFVMFVQVPYTNKLDAASQVPTLKVPIVNEPTAKFQIAPLRTLNYDYSEATDINDKGEIVGICGKHNDCHQAFMISQDGEVKILDLPGAVFDLKINNASQIAGTMRSRGEDDIVRGFFLDPQAGLTIIDGFCGLDTVVRDLNDLGQVVGYSRLGTRSDFKNYPEEHAFLWFDGNIQDLGTLKSHLGLAGDRSEAIAINNLGEIVGISNYAIEVYGSKKLAANKPFYWNGEMQEIPCGHEPVAINNKSDVALNDSNGVYIWNPNKRVVYEIKATAADMNDNGMLISKHVTTTNPVTISYFLDGKMYRYCAVSNVSPNIRFVNSITLNRVNNHNQAIGSGKVEDFDEVHAFVLR